MLYMWLLSTIYWRTLGVPCLVMLSISIWIVAFHGLVLSMPKEPRLLHNREGLGASKVVFSGVFVLKFGCKKKEYWCSVSRRCSIFLFRPWVLYNPQYHLQGNVPGPTYKTESAQSLASSCVQEGDHIMLATPLCISSVRADSA